MTREELNTVSDHLASAYAIVDRDFMAKEETSRDLAMLHEELARVIRRVGKMAVNALLWPSTVNSDSKPT